MEGSGHRQLDHTADLALELWARSEPDLLLEGARALVKILGGGRPVRGDLERSLVLECLDAEDRLVRWLNEILVLAVHEGFFVADAQLTLTTEGLQAQLQGELVERFALAAELKSVTYHDLQLVQEQAGWRARVVIDV